MRQAFVELFDLCKRIVGRKIDQGSSLFTSDTLDQIGTMSEFSEISEEKFYQYYVDLFKQKIYNKETKYLFLWDHMKVFKHISKNQVNLRLGENISFEKAKQINLCLPLAEIFIEVNNLKARHESRIEKNPSVYLISDEEYTLFFELTYRLYDVFFYLEKNVQKKSTLRDIKIWCLKTSQGQDPSQIDEQEMKDNIKETIKKANIPGIVSGMFGEEFTKKVDINSIMEQIAEDPESMQKLQEGDFGFVQEKLSSFVPQDESYDSDEMITDDE